MLKSSEANYKKYTLFTVFLYTCMYKTFFFQCFDTYLAVFYGFFCCHKILTGKTLFTFLSTAHICRAAP